MPIGLLFDYFLSQHVVDEIYAGDPSAVQQRLAVAGSRGDALTISVEAEKLTESV
jgi:hypothetical protein